MRSNDNYWHYHSEAPAERQYRHLFHVEAAKEHFFQISFATTSLRPTHEVTLRTNVTGWGRDILGVYWYGAWRFYLPKATFSKLTDWKHKFILNGGWQNGPDLVLTGAVDQEYREDRVQFSVVETRFLHSYENLRIADEVQQQNLLRVNCHEPSENEGWDIVIIGAGMGGGILADALTDIPGKKLRVLVLDAGSCDYTSHVDNLPTAALGRFMVEKDGNIFESHEVRNYATAGNFGEYVHMNLGGRSVFWSGLIPRMQWWELENWPKEVADYLEGRGYAAAEVLMRKHITAGKFQERLLGDLKKRFVGWSISETPRSWHQPEWNPTSPPTNPDSFIHCSTGVFSTAELLVDSLRAVQNPQPFGLHIKANHLVTKLEFNDANNRVVGVVCQDLKGNRQIRVRGKYVVLAAGSLESAKIALLSGLQNKLPLVGKGLTDHPSFYAPNKDAFVLKSSSPYNGFKNHARLFLYPTKDPQRKGPRCNIEIVLNDRYWRTRHLDDDVLQSNPLDDGKTTVKFKFVFGSDLQEANYVALRDDGLLWVEHPENITSKWEHDGVVTMLKDLGDFFHAEIPDFKDPNLHYGGGGTPHHAGGTLRMRVRQKPGVVGENLKVEGMDNLYVCDPSVYPYIPAANPSLTLAALALRLATHLAEQP